MPALHLLGTGSAVCDPHRTATMLALEWEDKSFLIDCGGDLYQRALMAGLDESGIEGLLLTHEHPDHISGFPLFMERLWLGGRTRPIRVYGIEPALEQARRLLAAFDTSGWTLPEVIWSEFPSTEGAEVISDETWRVTAAPGVHGVPVSGFRFRHRPTDTILVYSCDTEPCASIAALAAGCHILVHEATGEVAGHSSLAQAVSVAEEAGAAHLILVHLPRGIAPEDLKPWEDSAAEIVLGEELDRFEF
jgi:ribonuclease Z